MFIDIDPNREYFSFRNGVYFVTQDKFFYYIDPVTGKQPSECLNPSIATINYFDQDLPREYIENHKQNFMKIPTPHFDSIMDTQKFDADVVKWICVFLGRGLYWTKQLDNWEICLYLLGFAGTGKSTILQILRNFYKREDISIISNNIEKQWALSTIYDKKVAFGLEIRCDFKWDQAEFQTVISGEFVSVAVKHKEAFVKEFLVPIFLAGNEMVQHWIDNAGSLARRLMVIYFSKFVDLGKVQTNLLHEIKTTELGLLLLKFNRAYLWAVNEKSHQGSTIWNIVPEYFKKTNSDVMKSSHPLLEFLHQSDQCIKSQELYCPWNIFKKQFKNWYRDKTALGKNKDCDIDDPSFYEPIFAKYGITVKEGIKKINGQDEKLTWVDGVWVSDYKV
jgi:hypothetical protein